MWQKWLPILSVGCLLGSATVLADQAADPTRYGESVLAPWAINASVVGGVTAGPLIAVWFVWYAMTRRFPQMEKRNSEIVMELQKEYKSIVLELERRHEAHNEVMANNFRSDLAVIMKNSRDDNITLWATKREDDGKLIIALEKLGGQLERAGCKFEASKHGP